MPRNKLSDFDKNIRKEISSNLKKYMARAEYNQQDLSKLTGIPASTISGYVAMRSTPSPGIVQKLALALNVNKSDIDPRFRKTSEMSAKDERDLNKFLDSSEIMFDGDTYKLDDEDRQKLRSALEFVFWDAKRRNKRKKD